MSATIPPTADLDRPSDFGEFWRQAESAPRAVSDLPEPEIPVALLTPEQHARRMRLRRVVSAIMLALFGFTALAACVYFLRARPGAGGNIEGPKPVVQAGSPGESQVPAVTTAIAPSDARAPTEREQALAFVRMPITALESFESWTRLAGQLEAADRQLVERELSRLSVTGARPARDAARLELALLWRASARRAKAQKVLLSLAHSAANPLVKSFAQKALTSA